MTDISKFTGGVDLAKILSQMQIDCPPDAGIVLAHSGFVFVVHKTPAQLISFVFEPVEAFENAQQIMAAAVLADKQRKMNDAN